MNALHFQELISERRAADQVLFAIEQYDLDSDVVSRHDARGSHLRRACDGVAELLGWL